MTSIASDMNRALAVKRREGVPGRTTPRVLAQGEGWMVADVICTSAAGKHQGSCDAGDSSDRLAS